MTTKLIFVHFHFGQFLKEAKQCCDATKTEWVQLSLSALEWKLSINLNYNNALKKL